MGNEGPYGGKIEIGEDGSIVWQAAARSFPKAQDRTDSLDYAIRVISESRDICTSGDGKCIVKVFPECDNSWKQATSSAILIVSGYEEPEIEKNGIVIGRSYFITGARRFEKESYSDVMPPYDIHLTFDDYDLERAAPRIPPDVELNEITLSFCYQHWVKLSLIWKTYYKSPYKLSKAECKKVLQAREQEIWKVFADSYPAPLNESGVQSMIAWHKTYCHLKMQGFTEILDKLEAFGTEWLNGSVEFWLSGWKSVKHNIPKGSGETKEHIYYPKSHEVSNAPQQSYPPAPPPPPTKPDIKLNLKQIAGAVKDVFGQVYLSSDDLNALSENDAGEKMPISGLFVTGQRAEAILQSRTVVVKDVRKPGTFALMYHWGKHAFDTELCNKVEEKPAGHDANSEHHHSLESDEFLEADEFFTDDFITVDEDCE
ncbi:MAG: hypothetical protein KDI03_16180 [Anaerolineae bacterium]|nr:hypothetical protein [Anaerolineae bacterium]MCB0201603.1 hypothetical protein [Anaerolineae bacterium]MCB0205721.1 hypothetical protein [Anaerolineae bacterium]